MGDVYVYPRTPRTSTPWASAARFPATSCVHTEARNDLSEIRLEHPIDEIGRWAFLQDDYILKCDVPVRTVPPITPEGMLVTAHGCGPSKPAQRKHSVTSTTRRPATKCARRTCRWA